MVTARNHRQVHVSITWDSKILLQLPLLLGVIMRSWSTNTPCAYLDTSRTPPSSAMTSRRLSGVPKVARHAGRSKFGDAGRNAMCTAFVVSESGCVQLKERARGAAHPLTSKRAVTFFVEQNIGNVIKNYIIPPYFNWSSSIVFLPKKSGFGQSLSQ